METKHYVLLIGIVISLLLSYIGSMIFIGVTEKNFNDYILGKFLGFFIFSWIFGGIIFWVIKKIFLDEESRF